jgi:hypothetical protein
MPGRFLEPIALAELCGRLGSRVYRVSRNRSRTGRSTITESGHAAALAVERRMYHALLAGLQALLAEDYTSALTSRPRPSILICTPAVSSRWVYCGLVKWLPWSLFQEVVFYDKGCFSIHYLPYLSPPFEQYP